MGILERAERVVGIKKIKKGRASRMHLQKCPKCGAKMMTYTLPPESGEPVFSCDACGWKSVPW